MRWTLFRRRPKHEAPPASPKGARVAIEAPTVVTRANVSTGSLSRSAQLRDAALRFARDYLLAVGAKVRVEGPDLLGATYLDGRQARYTSSLARARVEQNADLLAPGSASLLEMLADVERRAGVCAFRLAAEHDARDVLRLLAPSLPAAPAHTDAYTIEQVEDTLAVECVYELRARWRGGVSHDWVTLAFDARTLEPLPVVGDELLVRASAIALPPNAATLIDRTSAAAEAALHPALSAVGRWLRLRSANEYAARRDDLRQTAKRLIDEAPDELANHRAAFERESQRVRDLFAISVEASLRRVAFVASPVCVARPNGSVTGQALRVDLGRGTLRVAHATKRAEPAVAPSIDPSTPSFAVADLTLLSERFWREAVRWLLEQMGHTVERAEELPAAYRMETSRDGHASVVFALQRDITTPLTAPDMRDALAADEKATRERILLTPNTLDGEARSLVERTGVRLLGHDALQRELDRLGSAYANQQAASTARAEALADAAGGVRARVIECLESLESVLARAANTRRAAAGEVAKAAAVLREGWALADQVFVAWDTLLGDWEAIFPERAARDGSLRLVVDELRLTDMRERADHLFGVTQGGFARVAATPGTGEMGYAAWRRALLEELTARCESLRWRAQAHDPAAWRDFARVTDTQASERAETARTSAAHARARAEKAFGQLATRARL